MEDKSRSINVCLTPDLYHLVDEKRSIVVVIDILRATSAICTAFEHGVKKIIPVAKVEEAWEYKKKGYLVGAERNGEPIDGFDFGNSPYSYQSEAIKDKSVVLTTTNGTKAISKAKNAYTLVVGAFTNFTALTDWLLRQGLDVVLLCSGWKGNFNLEDSLFAGAVAEKLSESKPELYSTLTDSALAAKYLFQLAKEDPNKFLSNSSHRRRLSRLNLKEDIRYCLQYDKTSVIPMYKGGELIRMNY